jgi:hypothetical protein
MQGLKFLKKISPGVETSGLKVKALISSYFKIRLTQSSILILFLFLNQK